MAQIDKKDNDAKKESKFARIFTLFKQSMEESSSG